MPNRGYLTRLMLVGLLTGLAGSAWAGDYQRAYQKLDNIKTTQKAAITAPLTLTRDVGNFVFEKGEFHCCPSVSGALAAVYFLGRGRFLYSPPLPTEADQLERFFKSRSLDLEFTEVLILCSDSTYRQLAGQVNLAEATQLQDDSERFDLFLKYIQERKGTYFQPEIMAAALDPKITGFFWAGVKTKQDHPLFFQVDPLAYEEVSFLRGRSVNVFGEYCEVVNQFHWESNRAGAAEPAEVLRQPLRVESYQIDCNISKSLGIDVNCRMQVRSLRPDLRWVPFYLAGYTFTPLEVDSTVWGEKASTEFYKDKEHSLLWVKCPEPLADQQLCTLAVFYHGQVIDKHYNWVYVKTSISWYPSGLYRSKASFDVTFHYPEQYSLIGVGRNLGTSQEKGVVTSRWVSDSPIRNFSFNMGIFKEYKMKEKEVPPVTILLSEAARDEYKMEVMASGGFLETGRDMKRQVGADIVNSIAFYQKVYGKCPVDNFTVSESPYWGGEAFPGMVNLSTATFQKTSDQGYDEVLRAHEVAHQWWGHGVDYATYHDKWLSEGLAEFSGLWYMQMALKDNKLYFKWLDRMRDDILDTRKYILSSGVRAGSIWLGYRASTLDTPEDFGLLVYYKGTWIIHMLRNILMDLNTMKEDRFIAALQEFYQTYLGRSASTDDFRKVMEKHAGRDLDWFFRQWVMGDKIPAYKFSYTTQITPEGKCRLTYRVEQSGVPDDFQMLIPLQFNFAKDQMARARVMVKGPLTQNTLLLPMKPAEIVFNPFSSVLCRQENVSWKD